MKTEASFQITTSPSSMPLSKPSLSPPSKPSRLPSSPIRDATSAAFAGVLSDIIFYGLDSYKVLLQSKQKVAISRVFSGALPIATLGSGPSFAIFFGLYSQIKITVTEDFGANNQQAALIASLFAGIPSSLAGVPADVLKKRMIIRSESLRSAYSVVLKGGLSGFFF